MTLYEVYSTSWEGSLWFTSLKKAEANRNEWNEGRRPGITKHLLLKPSPANLCRYLEGRGFSVDQECIYEEEEEE